MKKLYIKLCVTIIITLGSFTLFAQNTAPVFTSNPVTSVNRNQLYLYLIATSDADTNFVSITATTIPSWLSLNTKTSNIVSTFAGSGIQGFEDGAATISRFYYPNGVAVDSSGNVYVADAANERIRKITPAGVVSTIAGSYKGFADGTGSAAQFDWPTGVAVDNLENVYVADTYNNRIRKISPSGEVTTLAGSGIRGFADGNGNIAQFDYPSSVAVDDSGNVYVADRFNNRIRKITPTGVVSTLAGSTKGFVDGSGSTAQFDSPVGIALDIYGNVYVADWGNNCIRKITPAGVVTTLAGSGLAGSANGIGETAQFNRPSDVALDGSGNVFVADGYNNRIRKITPAGVVSTLAGSTQGFANGIGSSVQFYFPFGIAIDPAGNIYVADQTNNCIRKIAGNYILTGIAPKQTEPQNVLLNANDGNGGNTNQSFTITVNNVILPIITSLFPTDDTTNVNVSSNLVITFDSIMRKGTGKILINDVSNDSTYQIINVADSSVRITNNVVTINLPSDLERNMSYYVLIPATAFKDPDSNYFAGISDKTIWNFTTTSNSPPTFTSTPVIDLDENQNYFYTITTRDVDTDFVRVTTPTIPTWLYLSSITYDDVITIAGSDAYGLTDGIGTAAVFYHPADVAVDSHGNIFVADGNNTIRKITSKGVVSTFAGSGKPGFRDGTGTAAQFFKPSGVTVDTSGNVYVADQFNNSIRKITSKGVVSTLAGSGNAGYTNGVGSSAQFNQPTGVAVDSSGNIYVADMLNDCIRKITPEGVVSTLAGSEMVGFADGNGSLAQFFFPEGIAVDGFGNVYVADRNNQRIRKITPTGDVTTLAGSGIIGSADGNGNVAQFEYPSSVAVDVSGNVFVADQYNNRIREITPAGVVSTLAGAGNRGFADGTGTTAQFDYPEGIAVDISGNAYVADLYNNRIRKIPGNYILIGSAAGHQGVHSVVLNANDGHGGSANQSFTITVNATTSPTISTLSPTNNATDVTSSNLEITFSENVQKGTGNILIKKSDDNSVVDSIDVTDLSVSINNADVTLNLSPTLTFPSNTGLYIQIPSTAFQDLSGNAFAGISDKTSWSFTTGAVLGINYEKIKGLRIYPNPTSGLISFASQELVEQIQVFDLRGKLLMKKTFNEMHGIINLSFLPKGTYFIRISAKNELEMIKLVKH